MTLVGTRNLITVGSCWEGRDLKIHGSWKGPSRASGKQQRQVYHEAKEAKCSRPFPFRLSEGICWELLGSALGGKGKPGCTGEISRELTEKISEEEIFLNISQGSNNFGNLFSHFH